MKSLVSSAILAAWLVAGTQAEAGHEFPFYPSFYPQEIQIEVVDPASAAPRLATGTLHAYVGGDPYSGKASPGNVSHVEALGAYVVVTLNPAAKMFADRQTRCAAARNVIDTLAAGQGSYVFHPYPVTPYHGDFLQHVDLIESVKQEHQRRSPAGSSGPPLRIRAKGELAEKLVPARDRADATAWDAAVEVIAIPDLLSSRTISLNGWVSPPWSKDGWFHAYVLSAGTVADSDTQQLVEATVRRLTAGHYDGLVERLNLERKLVSLLRSGCERLVAGYTVKREYFNTDYSGGVENVAHDSHSGFNSAIFPRTVKLKDFPWNGWLTLGIATTPGAAWNPVSGFTDPAGRLIWWAVSDPALFPSPHGGSWVPNRVTPTVTGAGSTSGEVEVPPDALIPEPGTGMLTKVGPGKRAAARVLYRVLGSAFHDGTRMSAADLLYPFVFAYRWGVKQGQPQTEYEPFVDTSTALLRERLAGMKILRVERDVLAFGDDKLTYDVPVVEVYVNHRAPDPLQIAVMAPPWSTLPWHLLVLMEHAVTRGLAAFSRGEAARRRVAWLDLARDPKLRDALASLVDEFERQSYLPDSLRGFVTPAEARERWMALKYFYDQHRHFLVTNGPYRLHQWSDTSTTLQVFRDLTYPRGVGAFDRYAIPLRASVTKAEFRGAQLEVHAEVEKVERFGREYRIVTEPFSKKAVERDKRSLPVCRYVVVGPQGTVAKAGTAEATDAGIFSAPLSGLKPGRHTIVVALSVDGNEVNPRVKVIRWTF